MYLVQLVAAILGTTWGSSLGKSFFDFSHKASSNGGRAAPVVCIFPFNNACHSSALLLAYFINLLRVDVIYHPPAELSLRDMKTVQLRMWSELKWVTVGS